MKDPYKIGIIGCGRIAGWNELDEYREKPCTHVGGYLLRKDVKIVGCLDVEVTCAQHFAEEFNIPFYTNSLPELLGRKPDIVSICVPYKYHARMIEEVVRSKNRPKKILLEKPIAHRLTDAKKIVEICQKNKVKIYVNNRRLSPFYVNFRKILKQKFNNQILSVTAWCSSGIHTIGIHMVDLLRCLCGEVKSVYATQEKEKVQSLPYSHNFTPDDPRFNAYMRFCNGVEGVLFNTARTDFTFFEVEIICKNGRIRASDNGNRLVYQEKVKPGRSTLSYRLGEENVIKFESRPLFKLLVDEVLDGQYLNSSINGWEALKSYEVIDAMRRSVKSKQVQTI